MEEEESDKKGERKDLERRKKRLRQENEEAKKHEGITVTSSLIEISTDQQGVVGRGSFYSARPFSFLQQASGQIFQDDVNSFSSIPDICFMPKKEEVERHG